MNSILFFDLEADEKSEQIRDIGAIYNTHTFHKRTIKEFEIFGSHSLFLCGHNIFAHDIPLLKKTSLPAAFLTKEL
jgi:ATP-dependent DNA helicase RecQ